MDYGAMAGAIDATTKGIALGTSIYDAAQDRKLRERQLDQTRDYYGIMGRQDARAQEEFELRKPGLQAASQMSELIQRTQNDQLNYIKSDYSRRKNNIAPDVENATKILELTNLISKQNPDALTAIAEGLGGKNAQFADGGVVFDVTAPDGTLIRKVYTSADVKTKSEMAQDVINRYRALEQEEYDATNEFLMQARGVYPSGSGRGSEAAMQNAETNLQREERLAQKDVTEERRKEDEAFYKRIVALKDSPGIAAAMFFKAGKDDEGSPIVDGLFNEWHNSGYILGIGQNPSGDRAVKDLGQFVVSLTGKKPDKNGMRKLYDAWKAGQGDWSKESVLSILGVKSSKSSYPSAAGVYPRGQSDTVVIVHPGGERETIKSPTVEQRKLLEDNGFRIER